MAATGSPVLISEPSPDEGVTFLLEPMLGTVVAAESELIVATDDRYTNAQAGHVSISFPTDMQYSPSSDTVPESWLMPLQNERTLQPVESFRSDESPQSRTEPFAEYHLPKHYSRHSTPLDISPSAWIDSSFDVVEHTAADGLGLFVSPVDEASAAHRSAAQTHSETTYRTGLYSDIHKLRPANFEEDKVILAADPYAIVAPGTEGSVKRKRRTSKGTTITGNNAAGRKGRMRCLQCRKWKQKVTPSCTKLTVVRISEPRFPLRSVH